MYCAGMPDAEDGHAAPHETVVDVSTVIAAESVMPVVPSYAAIDVPDVMPVPEMMQPTQGIVRGVAVNVNAIDEPDVLPMPDPCDVKIDALPATTRTLIGPLPISATACAAYGSVTAVCACAENSAQHNIRNKESNFFI